ncbi:MAG: hypothetical protein IPO37_25680 [Saprospiraceae bacterium]|nr:hypothetical protein [Saprospiraceae bacterium]
MTLGQRAEGVDGIDAEVAWGLHRAYLAEEHGWQGFAEAEIVEGRCAYI